MQKQALIITILLVTVVCGVVLAFAAGEEVTGAHLRAGLTCYDCHETDEPSKRANQRLCIDCHGDKTDDTNVVTLKDEGAHEYKSTIHTSHAGQMRCTLCHNAHKPTTLYCNDGCHHTWQIKVPM